MKKALFVIVPLAVAVVVLLLIGNRHISTDVVIHAPADRVWAELTDTGNYPEWNPFIRNISGDLKKGDTIRVTFHTKGSDPVVFTPTVIERREMEMLQWEGRLLMPGIFTGRHTFQLVQIGPGSTKLIQKEDFNGILVPFFNFDSTVEGFTLMNGELKKRIEASSR
jgi:hypothetical protein